MVDGIAKTGKPVVGFGIEGHGDIATIAKASYRACKEFVQRASELEREECSIDELWVSTKCGESDTTTGLSSCPTVGNTDKRTPKGICCFGETSEITGAEHIAKERAINAKIGEKWMKVFRAYQDEVIEAHRTDNLMDSQPTKGNIAGGLTTIEEDRQPREDRAESASISRCWSRPRRQQPAPVSTTWTPRWRRPSAAPP